MKKKYITIFLGFVAILNTHSQSGTCIDLEPLSLENDFIIIENCYNGNSDCVTSAEQGPDYGCLAQGPFPAWFSMEVTAPGSIEITMTQNTEFDPNGEATGTPLDVDFIVWGPFTVDQNVCDYSNLSSDG